MRKINYKSDFDFILSLQTAGGVELGWRDYDWHARFWTGSRAVVFEVGCRNGVCRNCFEDNGRVHVVADNHGLSPGRLWMEFVAEVPDGMYGDGNERVVSPVPLCIELIREIAPLPEAFEVDALLPLVKGERGEKGDKGDKGDQGVQGERGERGEQGVKGDPLRWEAMSAADRNELVQAVADEVARRCEGMGFVLLE